MQKWSGEAGALLHWELHVSPQCPYASSVPSAGHRSCERGDKEENLSCLFLFPIILLYPCNLLLPNSLFSASFSIPNTFSSLLFAWLIAFLFFLSVSYHFSLFFCLSPCSQFQVLGLFSLFVLFVFLESLHCFPLSISLNAVVMTQNNFCFL